MTDWLDPIAAAVALAVAYGGVLVASASRTVRWAIRRELQGQLDDLRGCLDALTRRADAHREQHDRDRRALIAALDRQGIRPPDGWPHDPTEPPTG